MLHQVRYAIRGFVRRPAFAAALILSVALGIGGNAVVLGFMNGLVSRPVPLPPAPGLPVTVLAQHEEGLGLLSVTQFETLKASTLFEPLVAIVETRNAVRVGERPGIAAVATASPSAIEFFGLPKGEGVAISANFSATFTGGVRRKEQGLVIDGTAYRIAGTASDTLEGIYIGRPIDIWRIGDLPQTPTPTLSVMGRLRAGISLGEAQRSIGADLVISEYRGLAPEMQSAMNRLRGLMPAIAGAVFLIACANVAVLLLSRAAREARETAVRMAIGATYVTLAHAALVGAAVIAVAGAAAGILVAIWTSDVLPALLFLADAEQMSFVADSRGIVLTALVSALVIVVCGGASILENRRDAPARVLSRDADRSSGALGTVRKTLVVFQMALCCVLVISSLTINEALSASLQTAAGRRLDTMILVTVRSRYNFSRQDIGRDYFSTVEKTLLAEPGIVAGAWTSALPASRPVFQALRAEPPAPPTRHVTAKVTVFTPDMLDRVELPPANGRMFGGADTLSGCRVAVISPELAKTFPDGGVGRLLTDPQGRAAEIIGVVAPSARTKRAAHPDVYYYAEQEPTLFEERVIPLSVAVVPPQVTAMLDVRVVTHDFFEFMGLSVVSGEVPKTPSVCPVGVLNDAAAQLYFDGNAIGGALIDARGRRTTVVGVVREASIRATLRRPEPTLYLPFDQEFTPRMNLLLAATDTRNTVTDRLLRSVLAIDGGVDGETVVTRLDERLRRTAFAFERIAGLLLTVASVNALALAIIGLCRITADDVLERQREMAVRSALGAQGWRLVVLVLRRASRIAGYGIVAGTLAAILFVRWLRAVTGLEGMELNWLWLAGPAVVAIATLLASLLPARRILRLDPLTAMRAE